MPSPQFHETRIGQKFLEATVPALVRQLERLNELLERLVEVRENQASESSGGHQVNRVE